MVKCRTTDSLCSSQTQSKYENLLLTRGHIITVFIFAPFLISLFNDDPEVVAFGTKQCRIEGLFYFALAFSHCIAGILRGSGKATVPMFIMIGIWCVFRVTYLTVVLHFFHYVQIIYSVYPLTWSLSTILFLIYFLKADWIHGLEKKRV